MIINRHTLSYSSRTFRWLGRLGAHVEWPRPRPKVCATLTG